MSSLVRSIVERVSRGKSFRRKFKAGGETVELYVSPDAQLKYAKLSSSSFDADLIRIVEKCIAPGGCVWDVGANVGVFTFAASTKAKTVVTVEADTWLVDLLRSSLELESNKHKDIRVLPVAVSDAFGFAEFRIAKRGRASNSLANVEGSSQMGGERMRTFVPTITMDRLSELMPKPDFIKMDIEGAEALAFAGASQVISDLRPTFYAEISRKNFEGIAAYMKLHGYRVFNETGLPSDDGSGANFFFVPEEKSEMIESLATLTQS